MQPVHTIFLSALLLSGCAAASRNTSTDVDAKSATEAVGLSSVCQVLGKHKPGAEFPCAIDSIGLISKPRAFCGARIVTFGFVANTWGELALYPDEARANAQFIYSAISLGSSLGVKELNLLVDKSGGFYAEILGRFECNDAREFGLGVIELERVTIFDASQGDAARARTIFSAPPEVQEQ